MDRGRLDDAKRGNTSASKLLEHDVSITFGAESDFLERLLELYRDTMRPVIESAFGWDETFQQNRFAERYQRSWFHHLTVENENVGEQNVGFICFHRIAGEIHISLLILRAEFQCGGYGRHVMTLMHEMARDLKCAVTLSSFVANHRAVKFYQKLGYRITNQDKHFVDLVWISPLLN